MMMTKDDGKDKDLGGNVSKEWIWWSKRMRVSSQSQVREEWVRVQLVMPENWTAWKRFRDLVVERMSCSGSYPSILFLRILFFSCKHVLPRYSCWFRTSGPFQLYCLRESSCEKRKDFFMSRSKKTEMRGTSYPDIKRKHHQERKRSSHDDDGDDATLLCVRLGSIQGQSFPSSSSDDILHTNTRHTTHGKEKVFFDNNLSWKICNHRYLKNDEGQNRNKWTWQLLLYSFTISIKTMLYCLLLYLFPSRLCFSSFLFCFCSWKDLGRNWVYNFYFSYHSLQYLNVFTDFSLLKDNMCVSAFCSVSFLYI